MNLSHTQMMWDALRSCDKEKFEGKCIDDKNKDCLSHNCDRYAKIRKIQNRIRAGSRIDPEHLHIQW